MPNTEQLKKYAEILIRIGLHVQEGQPVSIAAPLEAVDFVRILSATAYDAGAKYVEINWHDPLCGRIDMERKSLAALQEVPKWPIAMTDELYAENAAFLSFLAADPDLLAGIDPERITLHHQAVGIAYQGIQKYFMEEKVSWLACSIPTKDWAQKMFPDETPDEAVAKLWSAIFSVMRMEEADPAEAWALHAQQLEERAHKLSDKRFTRLHYTAPGTDLWVGLPEHHKWVGARAYNEKGTWFTPNLPTEEIFTLPHRNSVEGTVRSTMPLAYGGVTIEGIELRFEEGRIVHYSATKGEETLKGLIETDEGSHYLGEIALVPDDSPISNLNLLFYNTLFDENASCHLAIGKAYPFCLQGGKEMSEQELLDAGANDSITHVDFMIGSAELDIDGETADGTMVPLFRKGNFVI